MVGNLPPYRRIRKESKVGTHFKTVSINVSQENGMDRDIRK